MRVEQFDRYLEAHGTMNNELAQLSVDFGELCDMLKAFNPDQPRDERGRWVSGGASSSQVTGRNVIANTRNSDLNKLSVDELKVGLKNQLKSSIPDLKTMDGSAGLLFRDFWRKTVVAGLFHAPIEKMRAISGNAKEALDSFIRNAISIDSSKMEKLIQQWGERQLNGRGDGVTDQHARFAAAFWGGNQPGKVSGNKPLPYGSELDLANKVLPMIQGEKAKSSLVELAKIIKNIDANNRKKR